MLDQELRCWLLGPLQQNTQNSKVDQLHSRREREIERAFLRVYVGGGGGGFK